MLNRLFVALTLLFVTASGAFAQTASGVPPFSSIGGGPDKLNLGNLNAHWDFPIFSKPGRGIPFSYALGYDTTTWFPVGVSGSQSWQPRQSFGWHAETEVMTGYASNSSRLDRCPNTGIHDGL